MKFILLNIFRDLFPHLWRLSLPSILMQIFINAPTSQFRIMDNFTGLIEFLPGIIWSLYYSWQIQNHSVDFRQILSTICVCLWSLRLGSFLLYRMVVFNPLDTRIQDLRTKYGFWFALGFWCGPHGFWSLFCCLPVTFLHTYPLTNTNFTLFDFVGLLIWSCGFIMETWADQTKLKKKLRKEKNYYRLGILWNYCRNPNHCGEIFCWLGISVMSLNLFFYHPFYQYNVYLLILLLISPFFTLCVMLFEATLSSERSNNKKFGDQSDYLLYRKKTSLLWPIGPNIYCKLPKWVRKGVFFEFDFYSKGLKKINSREETSSRRNKVD